MATTEQAPAIDEARVERFMEQIVGAYVSSAVALMVDVGHKAGLFEAAAAGPATSEGLAARAGLQERYVREWLGAVTTAGIFEYDPSTQKYTLPAEHALLLTGDSSANLAVLAPMNTHLAKHVDEVVEVFRTGGGVPYSAYRPEFTSAMDEIGRRQYDELLVDTYLPLAPGLVDRLEQGISVADLGCGTGHCINLMARAFPKSTFVGFDIADDALDRAREEAAAWGLTNADFQNVDVAKLPADARFDLITVFDAVHDQADPAALLRNAHEALADDGTFFVVDIKASSRLEENQQNPLAPLIYSVSVLHCMTVSLAEGGAGLGTAWGMELATQMMSDAGFGDVQVKDLEHDPFNVVYVCHK